MKKLLAFLLFCALAQFVLAQGTRIKLTQLERGLVASTATRGLVGITDNAGNQRYMVYVNVADNCITYTPTATGNTQNLNNFVQKCSTDSVWYIDFEGRSILLGRAGGSGTSDLDWLEIDNNQPPNNIRDSMYTYSYSSIGARMVWPGANFIVVDSVNSADQVIIGNRDARIALYNTLTGAWSSVGQSGAIAQTYAGPGTTSWRVTEASGANPTAPTTPFDEHMVIDFTGNNVQFNKYGNARRDAGTPNNVLGTTALGVLQSFAPEQLQPELVVDYSPGSPSIDPELYVTVDPNKGPFFARNLDGVNEIWQYDLESEIWVPYPLGGSSIAEPSGQVVYGTGSGVDSDASLIRDAANNDLRILGSNGNLSVRTADTTGVLNINVPSDNNDKARVNLFGNGPSLIEIPKNTTANTPSIANFYINRGFFDNVSPAGDNQVVNFGYNVSGGGGIINPYQAGAALVFENNYKNNALEPGSPGYGFFEFQWPEVIYTDSILDANGIWRTTGVARNTKRRLLAGYCSNERPSFGGAVAFTTDHFVVYDWKTNTAKVQWGFGENTGYAKGIRFLDTATIAFGLNNLGGIYQANAAGNAQWELLKLDNQNRMVLYGGGAGQKMFTPAIELEVQNQFTIAPGSSQGLTLGRTTTTGSVEVGAISAEPLLLKSSLNTTGYAFGLASYGFWLKDRTTGNQIFTFDNNVPANAAWFRGTSGNLGLGAYPDFDARLHIKRTTDAASSKMLMLENSTGKSVLFRSNASPEGNITANGGDICLVQISGDGSFWLKSSGTGNTGWVRLVEFQSDNSISAAYFRATGTGANKLPTGTTAQRPTATNGLQRLNTTTEKVEGIRNGVDWENFTQEMHYTSNSGSINYWNDGLGVSASISAGIVSFAGSTVTTALKSTKIQLTPSDLSGGATTITVPRQFANDIPIVAVYDRGTAGTSNPVQINTHTTTITNSGTTLQIQVSALSATNHYTIVVRF